MKCSKKGGVIVRKGNEVVCSNDIIVLIEWLSPEILTDGQLLKVFSPNNDVDISILFLKMNSNQGSGY